MYDQLSVSISLCRGKSSSGERHLFNPGWTRFSLSRSANSVMEFVPNAVFWKFTSWDSEE